MKLSNTTYDILKWVAQYLLPAAGTLYFSISQIWGLPCGEHHCVRHVPRSASRSEQQHI